jgi:hypothetical protein
MSKVTVARALMARLARRFIRFVTIIGLCVVVTLLLITLALVHFFSAWWLLLLVPIILLAIILLVIRFIVLMIVKGVHGDTLAKEQRVGLDEFIDKVQRLIETRATPPWVFAAVTIKDILMHRDITTIKKLISDSANLRRDYKELEKLF